MHEYWDKQPVPREDTTPGEIEETRDIQKKTTKLPDGFVYYYLWNWHLSEPIEPKEINLIIP